MSGYSQQVSSGSYDVEQQVCLPDQGQDFGSNQDQNTQVTGPSQGANTGQLNTASKNLGNVNGLNSGFSSVAGGMVDALVPNEGDKGKLEINVNVPVEQSGTVRVSFQFIAEVERDDKGIKGKVQVGGGVTAAKKIDAYFFTVDVFARAMVFGYMEATGSCGSAVFDHMLLGIQQRIAGVSKTVSDAVFSAQYIQSVRDNMREGDYVESGLGASFEAGASANVGTEQDPHGVGAGAGVSGQSGTRLTSDGRGGLNESDVSQVSGKLAGSSSPFALEGKLTGKWVNQQLSAIEAELAGSANINGEQLNELVVGGRWLSGLISQLGSIISGGSGLLKDQDAARQVGSLASFVSNASGSGVLVEAASARAIDRLKSMGVSLGHKLTLKGVWDAQKGLGLEITLERTQTIEFGDGPTDVVHVLLENVQRVFQVKVGSA